MACTSCTAWLKGYQAVALSRTRQVAGLADWPIRLRAFSNQLVLCFCGLVFHTSKVHLTSDSWPCPARLTEWANNTTVGYCPPGIHIFEMQKRLHLLCYSMSVHRVHSSYSEASYCLDPLYPTLCPVLRQAVGQTQSSGHTRSDMRDGISTLICCKLDMMRRGALG